MNDSVMYLQGAQSLASQGSYLSMNGAPIVLWPPLYSAMLATAGWLHLDMLDLALAINLVSYLGFGLCWYLIFKDQTNSVIISSVALILLLFSFNIFTLAEQALTEMGFLFLEAAMFLSLLRYIRTKKPHYFAVLIALSALLPLYRFAGALVVAGIGLGLLLFDDDAPLYRWLRTAVYGALSAIPLALWLLRNWMVSGTLTGGDKAIAWEQISETFSLCLYTIGNWFVPYRLDSASTQIGIAILVLTVLGMVILLRDRQTGRGDRAFLLTLSISTLLLFAFLVVILTTVQGAYRYLLPIYPVILLSLLQGVALLLKKTGRPSALIWCGWLSFAAVLAFVPLARGRDTALSMHDQGTGMAAKQWRQSEMIAYVRNLGLTIADNVQCDEPALAEFALHLQCDGQLPDRPYKFQNFQRLDGLPAFRQTLAAEKGKIYILYFNYGRTSLYSARELQDSLGLATLKKFPKGEILLRPAQP